MKVKEPNWKAPLSRLRYYLRRLIPLHFRNAGFSQLIIMRRAVGFSRLKRPPKGSTSGGERILTECHWAED